MALTTATTTLLSVGAPATPNPRLWGYSTGDTIAVVSAANYWAGMHNKMQVNDIIFAQCLNGMVVLSVSALAAATSTVATSLNGNGAPIWVQANCTDYGTAGAVGYVLAPVAGTIVSWRHITTTVVDADVILNIDLAGTNATGSITVAVSDTAVGITDAATVTAGGVVTAGLLIKIESDGGGTVGAGTVFVQIQP